MPKRKKKQKYRFPRDNHSPEAFYLHSLFDLFYEQNQVQDAFPSTSPLLASHPLQPSTAIHRNLAFHPLEIALEPAVVLNVMEFYKNGGPTDREVKEASAFGRVLASNGDKLLYRSQAPGETAELFNGLAKAVAVLAHSPGGVPLFGKRFDAAQIVAGFMGPDAAKQYMHDLNEQPKVKQETDSGQ